MKGHSTWISDIDASSLSVASPFLAVDVVTGTRVEIGPNRRNVCETLTHTWSRRQWWQVHLASSCAPRETWRQLWTLSSRGSKMRVSNGWSAKDLTTVCLRLNFHLVHTKYMLFCLLFSKSWLLNVYFVFLLFSMFIDML